MTVVTEEFQRPVGEYEEDDVVIDDDLGFDSPDEDDDDDEGDDEEDEDAAQGRAPPPPKPQRPAGAGRQARPGSYPGCHSQRWSKITRTASSPCQGPSPRLRPRGLGTSAEGFSISAVAARYGHARRHLPLNGSRP